ncbi:MAG: VCBS repeat-containing protein, partial [Candidatus Jordarchaeaceae archaeon]
ENEVVAGSWQTLRVFGGKTGDLKWLKEFEDSVLCCFVGDVDGDGENEVVAGSWQTLRVFGGKTGDLKWLKEFEDSVECCFVGDVDGDGENEVVAGSRDGILSVLVLPEA